LRGIVGVPGESLVVLSQRAFHTDLVTGRVLAKCAVVEVDVVMRAMMGEEVSSAAGPMACAILASSAAIWALRRSLLSSIICRIVA
jgi:hypothetical protein